MTKSNAAATTTPFPPGIGKPAQRALAAAGYAHLEQLATVTESNLLQLHGMGPKAIGILRAALAEMGLVFAAVSTPGETNP